MSTPLSSEPGQPPRGPFAALGRFAARRRWRIVVAWAIVLLVALPFAPRVVGALRAGGFILDDLESARAKALLQDELGTPPSAVVVVLHSDRCSPARRRSRPRPRPRSRTSPTAPGVVRILPHTLSPRQVSADGHTAYDVVFLSIAPGRLAGRAARDPRAASATRPGSRSSSPAARRSTATSRPSRSPTCAGASSISLPLAAIALLVVFGSVVAAALPLAVGGAAVLVALAAIFVVARHDADEHLRPQPRDAPRARASASTTRCS